VPPLSRQPCCARHHWGVPTVTWWALSHSLHWVRYSSSNLNRRRLWCTACRCHRQYEKLLIACLCFICLSQQWTTVTVCTRACILSEGTLCVTRHRQLRFLTLQPYPTTEAAARKYLSAPPTSVASEQLFSTAWQLYVDRRIAYALRGENAEKLLFQSYNICLFGLNCWCRLSVWFVHCGIWLSMLTYITWISTAPINSFCSSTASYRKPGNISIANRFVFSYGSLVTAWFRLRPKLIKAVSVGLYCPFGQRK